MAEEDTAAKPKQKQTAAAIIAAVIVAGFFGAFGVLLFVPIPDVSREALMLMIGALIAAFTTVTAYYFGSSVQSKAKDDTIHTLTRNGGSSA